MTTSPPPKLWDISQPLRQALPVWPGDTAFVSRPRWRMADGSPVNVASFETSTHAGTHADAPLHYAEGAADSAGTDLDAYVGPCRVVDARGQGGAISPAFVRSLGALPPRVLFRTYERFPHERWREDFTAIAADAVRLLAGLGGPLQAACEAATAALAAGQYETGAAGVFMPILPAEALVLDYCKQYG